MIYRCSVQRLAGWYCVRDVLPRHLQKGPSYITPITSTTGNSRYVPADIFHFLHKFCASLPLRISNREASPDLCLPIFALHTSDTMKLFKQRMALRKLMSILDCPHLHPSDHVIMARVWSFHPIPLERCEEEEPGSRHNKARYEIRRGFQYTHKGKDLTGISDKRSDSGLSTEIVPYRWLS